MSQFISQGMSPSSGNGAGDCHDANLEANEGITPTTPSFRPRMTIFGITPPVTEGYVDPFAQIDEIPAAEPTRGSLSREEMHAVAREHLRMMMSRWLPSSNGPAPPEKKKRARDGSADSSTAENLDLPTAAKRARLDDVEASKSTEPTWAARIFRHMLAFVPGQLAATEEADGGAQADKRKDPATQPKPPVHTLLPYPPPSPTSTYSRYPQHQSPSPVEWDVNESTDNKSDTKQMEAVVFPEHWRKNRVHDLSPKLSARTFDHGLINLADTMSPGILEMENRMLVDLFRYAFTPAAWDPIRTMVETRNLLGHQDISQHMVESNTNQQMPEGSERADMARMTARMPRLNDPWAGYQRFYTGVTCFSRWLKVKFEVQTQGSITETYCLQWYEDCYGHKPGKDVDMDSLALSVLVTEVHGPMTNDQLKIARKLWTEKLQDYACVYEIWDVFGGMGIFLIWEHDSITTLSKMPPDFVRTFTLRFIQIFPDALEIARALSNNLAVPVSRSDSELPHIPLYDTPVGESGFSLLELVTRT